MSASLDSSCLEIVAPSRLHFGLLEICPMQPYRFGGLGCMVSVPPVIFRAWASPSDAVDAPEHLHQRMWKSLEQARQWIGPTPPVRLECVALPPAHAGFGTGTQIACSIASLVAATATLDLQATSVKEWRASAIWDIFARRAGGKSQGDGLCHLAAATHRGKRSMIGLYGFLHGGWLFDRGETGPQTNLEVDQPWGFQPRRILAQESPEDLAMYLIAPRVDGCVSGDCEQNYFELCGSLPNPNRSRMLHLLREIARELALGRQQGGPLEDGRFKQISECLFEYGVLAGKVFEQVQYSSFRTQAIETTVRQLQGHGLRGVGQSSWGPTVYALVRRREVRPSDLSPDVLNRLEAAFGPDAHRCLVAPIATQGAVLRRGPRDLA